MSESTRGSFRFIKSGVFPFFVSSSRKCASVEDGILMVLDLYRSVRVTPFKGCDSSDF
jgi:hypothetical protein